MKRPKFILKEDWYSETNFLDSKSKTLIFEKGHEFLCNSNGEYDLIYGGWVDENSKVGGRMVLSEEKMRHATDEKNLLFDVIEYKEDIELIIEEIPDNDDEQVKRWRIQLDVNTTRKKLKEIEKLINETIRPIL